MESRLAVYDPESPVETGTSSDDSTHYIVNSRKCQNMGIMTGKMDKPLPIPCIRAPKKAKGMVYFLFAFFEIYFRKGMVNGLSNFILKFLLQGMRRYDRHFFKVREPEVPRRRAGKGRPAARQIR